MQRTVVRTQFNRLAKICDRLFPIAIASVQFPSIVKSIDKLRV